MAEGPMLEWFYPTRAGRMMAGASMSAILAVFGVILDGGFSWMGVWWLWILILPWPFIFLASAGSEKVYAGVDWLALDDDAYVKTYDLATVKVHLDGAAHAIEMVDNEGRSLRPKIIRLQRNHRLWDLVYNGILHSVHVGGAETNKRARDYLLLDHPPTLRPQ
ncbi:hypothetical protein [Prauserella halophila]|uniref:hypothetical protein n=2 Tax=Prauserella halophila TaxID=185641 RepID=UPI0020A50890|nr:hypothetical protein [Prauserella halophila]